MDSEAQERKNTMAGQMSLFDFVSEEDKADFEIKMPDVGEYSSDQMLEFEKEVLGIYVSGHPLQKEEARWRKHITNISTDFAEVGEDEENTKVEDKARVTIGGIITGITKKYTRQGQPMAFLTLEDLLGSVEVIVFPRQYEKYKTLIAEDNQIFVNGQASLEENAAGKVIANDIKAFDEYGTSLWIAFADKDDYTNKEAELFELLSENKGKDKVIIYLVKEKQSKMLPAMYRVDSNDTLVEKLKAMYGEKFVTKVLE